MVAQSKPSGFEFAKGGNTKMFGKQTAGSQKEGVTSHDVSGGDGKFAVGGKGKMFGKGSANTATPGQVQKSSQ